MEKNKIRLSSNGIEEISSNSKSGISFGQIGVGSLLLAGGIYAVTALGATNSSDEDTISKNSSNEGIQCKIINRDCEEDNSAKRQEYLDKLAQTTDTFNFYRMGESNPKTFELLEIDRNKSGSLGDRLENKIEGSLNSNDYGKLLIGGVDGSYEVEQGKVVSPTKDFTQQINQHYRNGDEESVRLTLVPRDKSSTIKTDKTVDVESREDVAKVDVEKKQRDEANKTRNISQNIDAMIVLDHPKSDSYEPFIVTQTGENNYTAQRMLYTKNDEFEVSRNRGDKITNLTIEDLTNLSYNVWSNPKSEELVQPTRDSFKLKETGVIDKTSHDMFRKGVSNLENRICEDDKQDHCIERKDLANAIGVSAVYEHSADKALSDLAGNVETPFYGNLKGDNSKPTSWAISLALPGDDFYAQAMTHYTGNVLKGNKSGEFQNLMNQCRNDNSSIDAMVGCVDNGVETIVDDMSKYTKSNGGSQK